MNDSPMTDHVRERLEALKAASDDWCDEVYDGPVNAPEGTKKFSCRKDKGHIGDHDCPAHRTARGEKPDA